MNPFQEIPLFASLDATQLAMLAEISRTKRYRRGELLFYEGDDPTHLMILTRGVLKLYKSADDGREVVLHRFTPVSMIAEMAVYNRIPFPATAVFESDGEVIFIDYGRFEARFLGNPELSRLLILSLSTKIRTLEAVIARNLVMDSRARVLHCVETTPELFASMRRYEIAAMLNMTPETLSRMLKKLVDEGTIAKAGEGYVRY